MGDGYARSLTEQGYGAEAGTVLDQLAVTGTPGEVRAQLERWDDAVDTVVIGLPPGAPWAVLETTLRTAAR